MPLVLAVALGAAPVRSLCWAVVGSVPEFAGASVDPADVPAVIVVVASIGSST